MQITTIGIDLAKTVFQVREGPPPGRFNPAANFGAQLERLKP